MSQKLKPSRLKLALNLLFLLLTVGGLVALFLVKDDLAEFTSIAVKSSVDSTTKKTVERLIEAQYNYVQNGEEYEFTFIELGSTGCISCMKMEEVMKEISTEYGDRVQVVFFNTRFPENKERLHYWGVTSIPTQLLLDRKGELIYRHNGAITKEELLLKMGLE